MMLPQRLTITLILAVVVFFVVVLWLLKKRRLALKYTLLWFLTGFLLLMLVVFPDLMSRLAALTGIQSRMNALYIFLIAFLIILVLSLTSIASRQTDRIRALAQAMAVLEERVRMLEAGSKDAGGNSAVEEPGGRDADGKTERTQIHEGPDNK